MVIDQDDGIRPGTTPQQLAQLKPVFKKVRPAVGVLVVHLLGHYLYAAACCVCVPPGTPSRRSVLSERSCVGAVLNWPRLPPGSPHSPFKLGRCAHSAPLPAFNRISRARTSAVMFQPAHPPLFSFLLP